MTNPNHVTADQTVPPQIVVMKFGGTSVATSEGRRAIAERVQSYLDSGARPVLVVSAMGRRGDPYATDSLLDLVEGHPSNDAERDWLASMGENISAIVIAHELRAADIAAVAMSGPAAGICASDTHGNAAVTEIDIDPVLEVIGRGAVPVVCGFQAMGPHGRVVTLGRGGSDTTACALGAALGSATVEIYTDVDGVMTADPRVVEAASVLGEIRADELFQMAKMGSKVVHAPAAELALGSGVPLYVKNTFSDHPGTRVVSLSQHRPASVATSVASTPDVARYRVRLNSLDNPAKHMAAQTAVYEALAGAGVSLDMFTPCGDTLLLSVAESSSATVRSVLDMLELGYEEQLNLAKVTVIGAGMHGVPGVMSRVARALLDADVDIEQAADSHTTISVLVDVRRADIAVHALHAAFGLADK